MNFFERQDQARKKTQVLVFYFIAAILLLVIAVNTAVLFLGSVGNLYKGSIQEWIAKPYWIYITLTTLLIIISGSLIRLIKLQSGGQSVAAMVGARRIDQGTDDPEERTLINVVEEMSIASGTPVPELYVMDQEEGINAFVAGFKPTDTVLVVTQGTLRELNRDELQGVIGHEFSHILNWDIRLNVRLIGILAGILAIGQMGLYLMRSIRYSRSTGGKRSGQGILLILGSGLALFLIGYIGLFFGRLIKAGISRQREFLADASSVQFTRNPSGIAGTLFKIKQHLSGSLLSNRHAEDMSHMCFGAPLKIQLKSLLATHPPLDERIRAIDPSYLPDKIQQSQMRTKRGKETREREVPMPQGSAGFSWQSEEPVQVSPGKVTETVGHPVLKHRIYASGLHASISDTLYRTLSSPSGARDVIFALLLSQHTGDFNSGLRSIQGQYGQGVSEHAADYRDRLHTLGTRVRLPLVELAVPSLKQMTYEERKDFIETVDQLIKIDRKVSLFEYVVHTLLSKYLIPKKGKPDKIKYKSFGPVLQEIQMLLSVVAYAGGGPPEKREAAFMKAAYALIKKPLPLIPAPDCTRKKLNQALEKLTSLSPFLKQPLIDACADCVIDDGRIDVAETELLRAISESLDCPMPPLIN